MKERREGGRNEGMKEGRKGGMKERREGGKIEGEKRGREE